MLDRSCAKFCKFKWGPGLHVHVHVHVYLYCLFHLCESDETVLLKEHAPEIRIP